MKQVIKHICNHYQLHDTQAVNDIQAAEIEAALQQQPCKDCKEKEADHEQSTRN